MKLILIVIFAVLSVSGFAAEKIVKIGLAGNFSRISSSSSNPYGNYFRNGINLALTKHRSSLEKAGIKIELVEFDYGDSQFAVLEAANKACKSDVSFVIGYAYSSHALLAAPIHQKCRLPFLTPSATADRLGQLGDFVHQGAFDNSFQGEVLAEYAYKTLNARQAVIVPLSNCAYCQDLGAAFKRKFEGHGGKVSQVVSATENDTDINITAAKVAKMPFDIVVVPNHELASARLIYALHKQGVRKPFLGGDGWGNFGEQFFDIVGDSGIVGYSLSHWLSSQTTPISTDFKGEFIKAFKKAPNDTSVLSYDAAGLLLRALTATGDHSRLGVEKALNKIETYEGVTGKYIFRKNRAPKKSILLLKTVNNRYQFLKSIDPGS